MFFEELWLVKGIVDRTHGGANEGDDYDDSILA
jgi:hypothetical protein